MRKIKSKIDKVFLLLFIGFLFAFSQFIVLFWTFLTAYFSEAKGTIVMIDVYGEAHLELFMFFLLLDFFIICLIYGLKRIFNKKVTDEV
jgi:hypothetical protein